MVKHFGARFKTITEMENYGMQSGDGCANIKIRGEWLEVDTRKADGISYKWGKNFVPRKVAMEILASAQ